MTASPRTALITGASSGIGKEFARQYAEKGYQLILVARRLDRLQELIKDLQKTSPQAMWAYTSDLSEPGATDALMQQIRRDHPDMDISVLVNNAGYGVKEMISRQSFETVQEQLQLMVNALTELSHAVIDGMKKNHFGRIINVASLAAFAPPGEGTLYSAIKQYVVALSQSMDMELKPYGIHVTALCPGFTHTEFHDVMRASKHAARIPKILWGEADEVVQKGIEGNEKGRPVVTPRLVNQTIAAVSKHLPEALRYQLGKKRPFVRELNE